MSFDGSSPRVRGTRHGLPRLGRRRRFIPACAGNSVADSRRALRWSVHPRVCGELVSRRLRTSSTAGSSPRVRGTRQPFAHCALRHRFIPACAGNSISCLAPTPTMTVHPRVCGELTTATQAGGTVTGSSPRVRGTRSGDWPSTGWRTVHPRVCGELKIPPLGDIDSPGSSPRVRGTRQNRERRNGQNRFIPACAGNSILRTFCRLSITVHPRVCGELRHGAMAELLGPGSSPRVRGTREAGARGARAAPVHPRVCGELPDIQLRPRRPRRFIPACAGNSGGARARPGGCSVHPRVCGELCLVDRSHHQTSGSSPRVRGTHFS